MRTDREAWQVERLPLPGQAITPRSAGFRSVQVASNVDLQFRARLRNHQCPDPLFSAT